MSRSVVVDGDGTFDEDGDVLGTVAHFADMLGINVVRRATGRRHLANSDLILRDLIFLVACLKLFGELAGPLKSDLPHFTEKGIRPFEGLAMSGGGEEA